MGFGPVVLIVHRENNIVPVFILYTVVVINLFLGNIVVVDTIFVVFLGSQDDG